MSPFAVSPECHALGLRAGAILFEELRIGPASRQLRDTIDAEAIRVRETFPSPGSIRSHPAIKRVHQILRSVGCHPRRHPPSTEKLIQFARRRETLPAINNLVDTYNLLSLQSFASLGAHDLDRIALPVRLERFRRPEAFVPLGTDQPQSVAAGEFGYVDRAERVLCRLDSLQAEFSKVTAATQRAILIIEATDSLPPATLSDLLANAAVAIVHQCGGGVQEIVGPN